MYPEERVPNMMPQGDVRKQKKTNNNVVFIILIVLLLAAGAGAYYWRDMKAKDDAKVKDTEIATLKQQKTSLEQQLSEAKGETAGGDETVAAVPTQAMVENIKAVFATGNTQPLSTYMSPTVKVILAASEGLGDRTPDQATADIESFMKNATVPWNFSIPEATLAKYRAGYYKDYFPNNAVIGKSGDIIISFSFDDGGKIKTAFMTTIESVLID